MSIYASRKTFLGQGTAINIFMASCEILEYKYDFTWNIENFLDDDYLKSIVQPDWPFVSSTLSALDYESELSSWQRHIEKTGRLKPSTVKTSNVNATVSLVAEKLNLKKQVFNVHGGCAGSLYALYIASLMSLENQTPVVVFAGDNLNTSYHSWTFKSIGALDQETGRPFDSTSNGFKMGTSMSILIVKHPSVKYNLDPKAVVQSFSFHTRPDFFSHPGNIEEIISNFSHIDYSKVDFWNAHATGTPVGDAAEYQFFSQTCKQDIPIVSFKGYFGHCISSSGVVEICTALDCKKDGVLKPNIILGDKIVADDRIITAPVKFDFKRMLKTNLAFGGKTVLSEIDLL